MPAVFFDKLEHDLRDGHVLAKIYSLVEHLGKSYGETVICHGILYLLARLPSVSGFLADGETGLEPVAAFGHHGAVDPYKVQMQDFLFSVQFGEAPIYNLIGLLKEAQVYL